MFSIIFNAYFAATTKNSLRLLGKLKYLLKQKSLTIWMMINFKTPKINLL